MQVTVEVVKRTVVKFHITADEMVSLNLADTHESGEAIFYMSDTGLSRVAVLAAALGDFEIGESGRYICSNKLLDYTTTTVVNKET
jgi:hypothetical protein